MSGSKEQESYLAGKITPKSKIKAVVNKKTVVKKPASAKIDKKSDCQSSSSEDKQGLAEKPKKKSVLQKRRKASSVESDEEDELKAKEELMPEALGERKARKRAKKFIYEHVHNKGNMVFSTSDNELPHLARHGSSMPKESMAKQRSLPVQ